MICRPFHVARLTVNAQIVIGKVGGKELIAGFVPNAEPTA